MEKLQRFLKNKYYLAAVLFAIWMLFFDYNDLITQVKRKRLLNQINSDIEYYRQEIDHIKKDLQELTTNKEQLEKFAREKYLMKKENEDIFLIINEEDKP